ncbi:MAG: GNAT family N-acetyltransferase [Actinomycetota bacterium]|nr:GNAT family N-acetyltransferase [Actinomycetota bacterium]
MTTIERLDPTNDEQFGEFHATYASAMDGEWDRPYTARELRVDLQDDAGYLEQTGLLARDDAETPVGVGIVEIPLKDNLKLVYVNVHVLPQHRRQGHGSALLDSIVGIAREHGRTTLFAGARWDVGQEGSANTAFAEALGFELDLVDAHRVLDLPATLPEAPVRDGYALHGWRGACPDEWVDQYANLLTLIVQEAPSGEYPLENEFFDAARVRSDEATLIKQHRVMQVSVALSPEGVIAGHTQLVFPEAEAEADPEDAYQWDTLVLPGHRGHGLGLSLKVHAMDASKELLEGRRLIHTYNAASNGPMIAVNELMGFRHVANCGEYIKEI